MGTEQEVFTFPKKSLEDLSLYRSRVETEGLMWFMNKHICTAKNKKFTVTSHLIQ